LSARILLGQSQLGREPAQLERSPLKLSVTSAESLLSLFVQRALTFLVPARLESRLSAAAFGDIQIDPAHSRDLAIGPMMASAQTVHPHSRPVGLHGAEYGVPFVMMPAQHVVEVTEHSRAVLLVHTRDPGIECLRRFLAEAVL